MAAATDPRPGAGEILLADEEKRLLAEALEVLSDESREVVTLYYREGRSVRHTAGLMTSLALGAPASAAAAGFGTAAKLSLSGPAKLVALLGGAALGAAGGILGIVIGALSLLARARDKQERRGIRLYVAAASTAIVAAAAGMAFSPGPLSFLLIYLLFCAILLALIFGWMPRVTARRLAAELTEDPGALERHRRERRIQLLAAVLGFLAATGAIFLDFLLSGGK